MTTTSWSKQTLNLRVDGVDLRIDALRVAGPEPVLFLHGFGSTKEEYADFTSFPGLAGRGFLAYDAPPASAPPPAPVSTSSPSRSWSTSPSPPSSRPPSTASTSSVTRWVVSPRCC